MDITVRICTVGVRILILSFRLQYLHSQEVLCDENNGSWFCKECRFRRLSFL